MPVSLVLPNGSWEVPKTRQIICLDVYCANSLDDAVSSGPLIPNSSFLHPCTSQSESNRSQVIWHFCRIWCRWLRLGCDASGVTGGPLCRTAGIQGFQNVPLAVSQTIRCAWVSHRSEAENSPPKHPGQGQGDRQLRGAGEKAWLSIEEAIRINQSLLLGQVNFRENTRV